MHRNKSILCVVFLIAIGGGCASRQPATELQTETAPANHQPKLASPMLSMTRAEPHESNEPKKLDTPDDAQPINDKCRLDLTLSKELCDLKQTNANCLTMTAEELHNLGQQKLQLKQSQAAMTILKHALSIDKSNGLIRSDYAMALLGCELYSEAVTEYELAAKALPKHVDIIFNLAQAYLITGRIDASVATYQKAVGLDNTDPEIRNNLAIALVAAGKLDQAESEVREATRLDPKNPDYLLDLGAILARKKRYKDAEIVLNRAIEQEPDNPDIYNMLGFIMFLSGQTQLAADTFRKALDIDPEHKGAKENLLSLEEEFDFEGPWKNKN